MHSSVCLTSSPISHAAWSKSQVLVGGLLFGVLNGVATWVFSQSGFCSWVCALFSTFPSKCPTLLTKRPALNSASQIFSVVTLFGEMFGLSSFPSAMAAAKRATGCETGGEDMVQILRWYRGCSAIDDGVWSAFSWSIIMHSECVPYPQGSIILTCIILPPKMIDYNSGISSRDRNWAIAGAMFNASLALNDTKVHGRFFPDLLHLGHINRYWQQILWRYYWLTKKAGFGLCGLQIAARPTGLFSSIDLTTKLKRGRQDTFHDLVSLAKGKH